MTRVIKTLLLWLLMAALPLQGAAAVVKASCGPAHHASTPAVTMADTHRHDHAGDGHHQHHDVAQHAATDAAYADTADGSIAAAHPVHTSSYCSACAACCVGAVAPPSVSFWNPGAGSPEIFLASPASLVTGYVPAGLERPPRKNSV